MYRNTTDGNPNEIIPYSDHAITICGVANAPNPPYKANSTVNNTDPVLSTALGLNATLSPSPPYSPVTFLPNTTSTAAQDVGVGAASVTMALLGIAALLIML